MGLEGVVAKRLGSVYQPGRRTPDWRKIKAMRTQDCVILGWTPGSGSRSSSFGALLVGAYERGELVWIGQVGSGFSGETLKHVQDELAARETDTAPIDDKELTKDPRLHWVRPDLVCEVEYLELTEAGHKLRAPSFKGLRPDKAPEDCVLEEVRA
jgi:bifunctional non-homologous end joining protein LigD